MSSLLILKRSPPLEFAKIISKEAHLKKKLSRYNNILSPKYKFKVFLLCCSSNPSSSVPTTMFVETRTDSFKCKSSVYGLLLWQYQKKLITSSKPYYISISVIVKLLFSTTLVCLFERRIRYKWRNEKPFRS